MARRMGATHRAAPNGLRSRQQRSELGLWRLDGLPALRVPGGVALPLRQLVVRHGGAVGHELAWVRRVEALLRRLILDLACRQHLPLHLRVMRARLGDGAHALRRAEVEGLDGALARVEVLQEARSGQLPVLGCLVDGARPSDDQRLAGERRALVQAPPIVPAADRPVLQHVPLDPGMVQVVAPIERHLLAGHILLLEAKEATFDVDVVLLIQHGQAPAAELVDDAAVPLGEPLAGHLQRGVVGVGAVVQPESPVAVIEQHATLVVDAQALLTPDDVLDETARSDLPLLIRVHLAKVEPQLGTLRLLLLFVGAEDLYALVLRLPSAEVHQEASLVQAPQAGGDDALVLAPRDIERGADADAGRAVNVHAPRRQHALHEALGRQEPMIRGIGEGAALALAQRNGRVPHLASQEHLRGAQPGRHVHQQPAFELPPGGRAVRQVALCEGEGAGEADMARQVRQSGHALAAEGVAERA
mmetsp:Transcript_13449/g.30690  ORF Transcript_13449/g.30690 Transcript_13449/m.30690 type:complete len:474 (+) Transcript_13449:24-1445(+)